MVYFISEIRKNDDRDEEGTFIGRIEKKGDLKEWQDLKLK